MQKVYRSSKGKQRLPVSTFSDILKEETKNDLDSHTKQNEDGDTATNEL